jgi:hypothetical protein
MKLMIKSLALMIPLLGLSIPQSGFAFSIFCDKQLNQPNNKNNVL